MGRIDRHPLPLFLRTFIERQGELTRPTDTLKCTFLCFYFCGLFWEFAALGVEGSRWWPSLKFKARQAGLSTSRVRVVKIGRAAGIVRKRRYLEYMSEDLSH